ncbi:MAG: peptidase S10 [Pyrinomonadaceae bacterium]|nr:peptidase S10 [Pyrinomonadaceae bacterium]
MPTAAKPAETPKPPAASQPDEPPTVMKHTVKMGNRSINYTTTTGFMPIKNRDGETEAKIFFMAYTLDDAPNKANRPLMFSFNGGPGSASVWLHLGALGPKRVKMLDDGFMPPPPYKLENNESSWLPETDLVFIDPVGTGYSRAMKQELNQKFFSVNGDIESVGEFIRMYLSRNERWNSPLFLVGESYGTTRASGLSDHLFERGIAFNGILLVSSVMNFQTLRFAEGNDLPFVLIFPSYVSTAWYHKKLSAEYQQKPLRDVLNEAENFASNGLTLALAKGDKMDAGERQAAVAKFAQLTGLSQNFVSNSNLRIELSRFNKELMRDTRRTTGRLDSRFTGVDGDVSGESPGFDPSLTAIRPPYTSTFNDYVRSELGHKSDSDYYILGGGVSNWNWNTNNGYANTSVALREAMQKNPYMKVFIASGYYDMATPYFATEYTIANMNLEPNLRRNITFDYYEAGHMMYIERNSLRKLKEDVTDFIGNSIKANASNPTVKPN